MVPNSSSDPPSKGIRDASTKIGPDCPRPDARKESWGPPLEELQDFDFHSLFSPRVLFFGSPNTQELEIP